MSKAALHTTAKMVVKVARSFNLNTPDLNIETLPLRCSHLVRAPQHLRETFDGIPTKRDVLTFGKYERCLFVYVEGGNL